MEKRDPGQSSEADVNRRRFLSRWLGRIALCDFISDSLYLSQLRTTPENERNRILLPDELDLPTSGLCFIPVEHHGNGAFSPEEVEQITALVSALEGVKFQRQRDGSIETGQLKGVLRFLCKPVMSQ